MKRYKLLKDLPFLKAGVIFQWDKYMDRFIYPTNRPEEYYNYSQENIDAIPNWFEEIIDDGRWKPSEDSELYYIIHNTGSVETIAWQSLTTDILRFKFFNCFKTRAEAEEALELVKQTLRNFSERRK